MSGHSAGDVAYNFLNDSFLKQLKFGARYADREQDIKYTTYNWGSLSEVWSGAAPAIFMDQVGAARRQLRQLLQLEQFLQRRYRKLRRQRSTITAI